MDFTGLEHTGGWVRCYWEAVYWVKEGDAVVFLGCGEGDNMLAG